MKQVDHRNFSVLAETLASQKDTYLQDAFEKIKGALGQLYGGQNVSLQQLSATFQRGDLLENLGY
jgi:hypothetical protein